MVWKNVFNEVALEVNMIIYLLESQIYVSVINNSKTQYLYNILHLTENDQLDEISCKYCFQSENTIINPLVNICNCKGGLKYLHYECLKLWINTKIKKEYINDYVTIISISQFYCELCDSGYPIRFYYNK